MAVVALLLVAGGALWAVREELGRQEPHQRASAAAVAPTPASPQLIVVPEPDPAAQGLLLDRWARATAQLVPLGN